MKQASPTLIALTELDWNFENVPKGELIACCLWEYARESNTLRLAADAHWCNVRELYFGREYERNPKLKSEHDAIAEQMARKAKAAGFDYGAFLRTFWEHDVALVRIYETLTQIVRDGARPWQVLDKELRTKCVREVSESLVLRPFPSLLWVNLNGCGMQGAANSMGPD